MRVYRIAKAPYVSDLTGWGASVGGGRWNEKGVAMVYTAESRSLAALETLAHFEMAHEPLALSMAVMEIPDEIAPEEITTTMLPRGWQTWPSPSRLADLGSIWVRSGSGLMLRVPSELEPDEHNILLNPSHPDMERVTLVETAPYSFDVRLLPESKKTAR